MAQARQYHLYVYTRKIFNINNSYQNFDLIPKLFYNSLIQDLIDDPQNQAGIQLLNQELTNIRQTFAATYPGRELNKLNIYEYLLRNYVSPNLTKVRFTEFNQMYWNYIIETFEGLVQTGRINNSVNNIPEIDLFVTHLLRSHETMEYGLYFSFKYAYDDNDFHRFALQEYQAKFDIIYFIKFSDLIDHIYPIKSQYLEMTNGHFPPVLYANNGWDYGVISENSVIFNNLDLDLFWDTINNYRVFDIQSGELICQLPLPIDIFRSVYIKLDTKIPFGPFRKKYLKYKQKYLELKKLNN